MCQGQGPGQVSYNPSALRPFKVNIESSQEHRSHPADGEDLLGPGKDGGGGMWTGYPWLIWFHPVTVYQAPSIFQAVDIDK